MNPLKLLTWTIDNWALICASAVLVVGGASVVVRGLSKLVSELVTVFPSLKSEDDELRHVAAWLDAVAKSKFLNGVALNPPAEPQAAPVARTRPDIARVAIFALAALAGAFPTPARAQSGFTMSAGPSIPVMEYRPGNPHPVQIAAGAGAQLGFSHSALERTLFGKAYDLLDLDVMAFGTLVSGPSGGQFGALSAALSACTLNSMICAGVGHDVLDSGGGIVGGGPFFLLSFSLNFALDPPPQVAIPSATRLMLPTEPHRRGNTIYF